MLLFLYNKAITQGLSMKTIYYYALCIITVVFHAHAMENDMIKNIRIGASTCTLIGGWGFFAANSQYFMNKLSYRAKRAPLALFLVGCSINQSFIITKNIKNKEKYHE